MAKIILIHPSVQLFNIPCVVNLAESIAHSDENEVHFVRMRNSRNVWFEGSFSNTIHVEEYIIHSNKRRESISQWLLGYTVIARRVAKMVSPDLIIGMGARGLIVAWILSKIIRVKFIYYNLEFYTHEKQSIYQKAWNRLEGMLSKSCSLLIIHDENRASIYKEIVGNFNIKHIIFPNSPIIVEVQSLDLDKVKSIINFSGNSKYLIYSGGLHSRVGREIERLCESLLNISEDWVLILQSHDGIDMIPRTDIVLKLIAAGRLIINSTPLTPSEYSALLELCHIGIANYNVNDPNMNNVGLSSGKIAAYWMHGLPVLVNNIPFYRDILEPCMGGGIYESYETIAPKLRAIINDYDSYRAGALSCYRKFFLNESYARAINEMISSMVSK
ncbi:MAG TPA: hypothetical protein DEP36_04855 [Gammaproteobacteria bacterium]|nr:hypothetical protein [Gammaproteobacteria bacterium]